MTVEIMEAPRSLTGGFDQMAGSWYTFT